MSTQRVIEGRSRLKPAPMYVFGPPFVLVAAMLAVSLSLGTGATLHAEDATWTHAAADTEIGSSPPTHLNGDAAAELGQPFDLTVGETAVFEDGSSVRFETVIGDSRCPADVVCVWEGNAEIAIEVATPGEDPASVRLNTNPSFATEATYLAYTVELIGLEPYPRTGIEIDDRYLATMAVGLTGVHPTPTPQPSPSAVALIDAQRHHQRSGQAAQGEPAATPVPSPRRPRAQSNLPQPGRWPTPR